MSRVKRKRHAAFYAGAQGCGDHSDLHSRDAEAGNRGQKSFGEHLELAPAMKVGFTFDLF